VLGRKVEACRYTKEKRRGGTAAKKKKYGGKGNLEPLPGKENTGLGKRESDRELGDAKQKRKEESVPSNGTRGGKTSEAGRSLEALRDCSLVLHQEGVGRNAHTQTPINQVTPKDVQGEKGSFTYSLETNGLGRWGGKGVNNRPNKTLNKREGEKSR